MKGWRSGRKSCEWLKEKGRNKADTRDPLAQQFVWRAPASVSLEAPGALIHEKSIVPDTSHFFYADENNRENYATLLKNSIDASDEQYIYILYITKYVGTDALLAYYNSYESEM